MKIHALIKILKCIFFAACFRKDFIYKYSVPPLVRIGFTYVLSVAALVPKGFTRMFPVADNVFEALQEYFPLTVFSYMGNEEKKTGMELVSTY
ncbi:MAG: hypothetical protein V5A47_08045 [Bacteroidales bacterium]|nr:hypothetical protein [Bacteroidales bacterium]